MDCIARGRLALTALLLFATSLSAFAQADAASQKHRVENREC